jgi:hypothetical protein
MTLQALNTEKQEKKDIFTTFLNKDIHLKNEFNTYFNEASLIVSNDFNLIQ